MTKRIMLVDDTETVLMFEKIMLSGHGYEVVTAKNGADALEKVASRPPDLILLDIQMPEMDGIETCRNLKNNPKTQTIPVVMVTTKGTPEKVEAAFMAGCNDYLTKPVDKLEFLTKVKSFLG